MINQEEKDQNLKKEKLFKDTVPRSRVQLDIVKRIRTAIENMPSQLPAKIISYQDVIRENGEYYLLYKGSEHLEPLVEYLNKNSISTQKLFMEFKEIIELTKNLDVIKKLFPDGINAANFWVDRQENIYLMPEEFLRTKRNYNEFRLELPSKEYFMPPEIIEGEDWQTESYIFNLAAVLYFFLSGETIFSDQDNAKVLNKIQSENILELKTMLPKISQDLNDLIMLMLEKDKSKRAEINYASEQLGRLTASNNFNLEPLIERKDLIDKKIIKKKRRNENIKLFFRQSWKVILFFVIIGGSFIWSLSSGPGATITAENTPAEVVNYFYQAIGSKNISLANEAAEFDLGEMERMISETHVIEKMQQAYGGDPENGGEVNEVYSLENLNIERLSSSENSHQFRVNYDFNFRDREGRYSQQVEDELLLEQIDGVWKITEIEGGLSQMISGDYPWRDEE